MNKQPSIGKISFLVRTSAIVFLSLMIFLPVYLSMNNKDKKDVKDDKPIQITTPVIPTDTIKDSIKEDTTKLVRIKNLPTNFDTVPGGNNVFRSNQPNLTQLELILSVYDIETVVRMNDIEGTGVSISAERKLVESMGKKFVWINAHLGYKKDSGYIKSMDTIQPYLQNGKVLIHCTAGADRTGYQVAKYLKDKFDWSEKELWNYTTKYNYWEKFICQGKTGYIRYMEAFYTFSEWCKDFGQNCSICDKFKVETIELEIEDVDDVWIGDPFEDPDYIGTPCGDYDENGNCTRHNHKK